MNQGEPNAPSPWFKNLAYFFLMLNIYIYRYFKTKEKNMVNVTVIKGKDAVKYLVRIIVVSFLIFILSRYFVNFNKGVRKCSYVTMSSQKIRLTQSKRTQLKTSLQF